MQKKPYTPPTITEHGSAVEKTKGFGGEFWELANPRPTSAVELDW
jgi:hypothetical protein